MTPTLTVRYPMPKAPEGYQPLLNRGSRGSLWLADDHLLVIETTRFLLSIRETYRRLDFTNIQAILHTKSQRGAWLIVLISVLLVISLLILLLAGFDNRAALFFASALALPALAALVVHFIKGQTRALMIQTTVRPWRLKMVTRHSHVIKVLTALEPLCREAQKEIPHTPSNPDSAPASTFKPFPSAPPVSSDNPPSMAGAHPLAFPAWLCHMTFAAMMGGEMIWNSIAATLLMMCFAAASFTCMMIAFTRGGGSLAIGGRGVFIFALSMLGVSLVAGYVAAMAGVVQASIRGDSSEFSSEESFLRAISEFPEGSPDALSIVAITIIVLTGISAVAGLLATVRRNKLQRTSMEPTTPPSS